MNIDTDIKMNKVDTYIELFKTLGKFANGETRIVCVDEFTNKFACLKLGNGGSWCRFDSRFGKDYKVITYSKNGKYRFSWDTTEDEEKNQKTIFEEYLSKHNYKNLKGRSILLIKICGIQNKKNIRPISKNIRKHFKNKPCVVCGNNNDLIIDHKNGLYNDERVLNTKTQTIEDFQVLCNHCNLQKRQSIVWTKQNKKRYPASNIPQLRVFNIDFTEGDENYSDTDKNAMVGSYFYDPVNFMKKIILKLNDIRL
jgi:hypothetical protein